MGGFTLTLVGCRILRIENSLCESVGRGSRAVDERAVHDGVAADRYRAVTHRSVQRDMGSVGRARGPAGGRDAVSVLELALLLRFHLVDLCVVVVRVPGQVLDELGDRVVRGLGAQVGHDEIRHAQTTGARPGATSPCGSTVQRCLAFENADALVALDAPVAHDRVPVLAKKGRSRNRYAPSCMP